MTEKRRVSCPIRHVTAFVLKHDDGSIIVKCSDVKICGASCPYLENADYKSAYKRAPDYKPE